MKKQPSSQSIRLAAELSGIIAESVLNSTIGFEDRIKNEEERPFVLAMAMSMATNMMYGDQLEWFIDLLHDTERFLDGAPTEQ